MKALLAKAADLDVIMQVSVWCVWMHQEIGRWCHVVMQPHAKPVQNSFKSSICLVQFVGHQSLACDFTSFNIHMLDHLRA